MYLGTIFQGNVGVTKDKQTLIHISNKPENTICCNFHLFPLKKKGRIQKVILIARPMECNGFLYLIENSNKSIWLEPDSKVECMKIMRDTHVPYVVYNGRKIHIPELGYTFEECTQLLNKAVEYKVLAQNNGNIVMYDYEGHGFLMSKDEVCEELHDEVEGRMALTGKLHKLGYTFY